MFIFLICSRKIYLAIVPKWGLKVPKYFWKYLQFCSKHEIISKQPFWLVGTPLSNHNRRTIIWYNQLQLHILCTYFQSFCPVIYFNASLNLLVLKHIKLGKTWGYRKQSAPSALQVYLKRGLTDLCINKKKNYTAIVLYHKLKCDGSTGTHISWLGLTWPMQKM